MARSRRAKKTTDAQPRSEGTSKLKAPARSAIRSAALRPAAKPRAATASIPGTDITFVPGGLHRSLGVAPDQPIPLSRLAAAAQGDDGPKAEREAALARTLEAMAGRTPGIVTRARQRAVARRRGPDGG